ncbi:hypothetical protein IF2G_08129 [Cordyceps javanica]|nr:hypothetical protein IF2G_08129 [Cordyceps javanica]
MTAPVAWRRVGAAASGILSLVTAFQPSQVQLPVSSTNGVVLQTCRRATRPPFHMQTHSKVYFQIMQRIYLLHSPLLQQRTHSWTHLRRDCRTPIHPCVHQRRNIQQKRKRGKCDN